MKKKHDSIRDVIYIHLNETDQYVISYGIEFDEFIHALSNPIEHVLLLKHNFTEGDFNMHTLLDFVPADRVEDLVEDGVYMYGNFCWIDFTRLDSLNELTGQEIAEFLYLGHLKQHLRLPFYNRLNNRFAYLAHDDGWFNKIYYRDITEFYHMLGPVMAYKTGELKPETSLFGLKKNRQFPIVPGELLLNLKSFFREGMVFSLKDTIQTRVKIEIPFWAIGDFVNMDDMYDEFEEQIQKEHREPDGKLVFDRKTREWKAYTK